MRVIEILFQVIAYLTVGSIALTYLILFVWYWVDVARGKDDRWQLQRRGRSFWK